jgi:hypothetical protein
VDTLKPAADTLFILLGAIMVLAMHAGFAFLELGTVRKKNQVNALVKILVDFSVSTVVYFFVGYTVAYGVDFMVGAETLAERNGYELVKFFFLLTFAAAIPAIISGGIAERSRFGPQLIATAVLVGRGLPAARRCGLGRATGAAGLDRVGGRCTLPRFRGQRGGACLRRLGRRWRRCCCSARATTATARMAASARTRRRASRSWPWAPGCWRWAGSAST